MAESKTCINLQIKVYPEEKARFLKLKDEMDGIIKTDREAFISLMDFFENPKTVKIDNPEHVKKIEELKLKIEELTNLGNDNAISAQRFQHELEAAQEEIEELQETIANLKSALAMHQEEADSRTKAIANRPANIFEVEVHPVPFYFLNKMSEYLSTQKKAEVTPGYILVDLFVKDLQNPRSNHLPYTVTTEEIKKVTEEYRKAHPEEN